MDVEYWICPVCCGHVFKVEPRVWSLLVAQAQVTAPSVKHTEGNGAASVIPPRFWPATRSSLNSKNLHGWHLFTLSYRTPHEGDRLNWKWSNIALSIHPRPYALYYFYVKKRTSINRAPNEWETQIVKSVIQKFIMMIPSQKLPTKPLNTPKTKLENRWNQSNLTSSSPQLGMRPWSAHVDPNAGVQAHSFHVVATMLSDHLLHSCCEPVRLSTKGKQRKGKLLDSLESWKWKFWTSNLRAYIIGPLDEKVI